MELLHTCEPLRALAVRERLGCAMFNGMSGDTLAEPGDEEGGVPGGTGRKAEAGDSAVAAHARAILEAAQAAAAANAPQEKTFRFCALHCTCCIMIKLSFDILALAGPATPLRR